MPLIALAATPPVPVPRGLPRKHILWESPTGDVIDLTDANSGYSSPPGRSGFGVVPREVVIDQHVDGASLRTIQVQPRIISYPIRVQGRTYEEYLERLRRLQAAFRHPVDPLTGRPRPGKLRVLLPDGSAREISAYYRGGLDAEEDPLDDLILKSQVFPEVEFVAPDPYWTGGVVVSPTWRTAGGRAWFGGPLPRVLAASQVLGEVSVLIPGDAESYPVWTITGPGAPVIRNDSTGREWRFKASEPLDTGQVVTVDTRPDVLSVEDQTGTSLYGALEDWPDLWPLEPGVNHLTVEMVGADAHSSVKFEAAVRWQAGW